MVVDVTRITALLEQHPRILKPQLLIFFEDEIGAYREHDCEGVRVRFDVGLRVEPIEDAEAHRECPLAVFLVLREGTCIHDSVGCVNIRLDIRIALRFIKVPQIGQNHLRPHRRARLATLGPRINHTCMRPSVGLVTLIPLLILVLHDLQNLLSSCSGPAVAALGQRVDERVIRVGVRLDINVPAMVEIVHVVEDLLGTFGATTGPATGPRVDDGVEGDRVWFDISIACLVEAVHPLKDGLSTLGSRLAFTTLGPGVEDCVEVDGCGLDILAAVSAESVDHVMQDTFCPSSSSWLSALSQRVDDGIVCKGVWFEVLIPRRILCLHLIQ
mmetsp:Transcript_12713/g.23430  ORF Transcript_12713/g.23430 Transcript_12713/m.23430 type:complete len:328 (+) Transcript_12713:602-1585(+)